MGADTDKLIEQYLATDKLKLMTLVSIEVVFILILKG